MNNFIEQLDAKISELENALKSFKECKTDYLLAESDLERQEIVSAWFENEGDY